MLLPLYKILARNLAIIDGANGGRASDRLDYIEKEFLPSGSGFDAGTKIERESSVNKIVLLTSFHHMNENGYYDGWTEHKIIIKPCLQFGFTFTISGRDKRQIKEYIEDMLQEILSREIDVSELPR